MTRNSTSALRTVALIAAIGAPAIVSRTGRRREGRPDRWAPSR